MKNPYATPEAILSEPLVGSNTYEPKLFSFHGRIGRLRFLAYIFPMMFILSFVLGILTPIFLPVFLSGMREFVSGMMIAIGLVYILSILISLILAKRRLNDLDHAGWWALLLLVPFVNFILGLYLIFGAGTKGPNRYGLPPAKNSILVVIGAMGLPVIAAIGILAAVAVPAYQQYQQRAKAAHILQQQQP